MTKFLVACIFFFLCVCASPSAQPANATSDVARLGAPIPALKVRLERIGDTPDIRDKSRGHKPETLAGNFPLTMQTDANGEFLSAPLPAGRYRITLEKATASPVSPRDQASGMATGKRQRIAPAITTPDEDSFSTETSSTARTAAINHNTTRSNKQSTPTADADSSGTESGAALKTGINTSRSNIKNGVKKSSGMPNRISMNLMVMKQGRVDENDIVTLELEQESESGLQRMIVNSDAQPNAGVVIEVASGGRVSGTVRAGRHEALMNSIRNVR